MSAPRAALAFVEDIVSHHGEPVVDGENSHVRVRLTQQELARTHGCAPSTISWYLRRLGPAVVSRRDGIVFDRHALIRLHSLVPHLAPRTAAVERELLQSFAQPTADGTCELVSGDPTNPRPASLQDLAAQLGINRSSAHRHVAALEQAGRLKRRGRRLYAVSPDAVKEPTVDQEPQPAQPSPSATTGTVTPEQVLHLLDKVTELLTLVAGIAGQLLGTAQTVTSGAHDPRFCGAQTATDTQLRATGVAAESRGVSLEVDLIDRIDAETTSNPSILRAAGPRNPEEELRASDSRIADPRDWTTDDLPNLLAPLLEECVRRELPGVTDARRVADSLRPYQAEQIAAAARQMAADLRSGAPMRSPIAILVRKAEDGDPYYFRAPRGSAPPPVPLPPLVEPGEPIDDEAVEAVDKLGAEAMRQLDEAVAAHVRSILGDHTSALDSPDTLTYWRPIVWRQQQQSITAEGS